MNVWMNIKHRDECLNEYQDRDECLNEYQA